MKLTADFCPLDFMNLPAATLNFQTYLVKATRQDVRDDEHSDYFFLKAPAEYRLPFFLAFMLKNHVSKSVLTLENLTAENYKNIPELDEVMSSFCVIDGVGQDTVFDFRVKEISEVDAFKIIEYIEVNPLNTDFVPELFLEAM
ncbi:hypothetical protein [Acinetobacter sp. YH01009]|uniref:hypothetical protein n=1 Tax=Acinetobacter TaxID=469 RepID=UPI0015D3B53D|nr:hypothetical protein [Acinetobacter sp. YH01009]